MRRYALACVLVLWVLGCQQRPDSGGEPTAQVAAKSFSVAVREPGSMDPAFLSSSQDFWAAHQLFVGLYRWDSGTGRVVPALARSATTSSDGLTWRFELDPRYRFSDGTAITADLVVSSWTRLVTPAVGSPGADALSFVKGAKDQVAGRPASMGLKALPSGELEVVLEKPTPHLSLLLASPRFGVVPPTVLETQAKDASKSGAMVTSGPYSLASWEMRQSATLTPNPNWPGGKGPEVQLKFAESEESALSWWASKTVDLVVGLVPLGKVPELFETYPGALATYPLRSVYYLVPNVTRPGLDDAHVRKALAMSLDRQALVDQVLAAGQLPAQGMLPKSYVESVGLQVPECWMADTPEPKLGEAARAALAGKELLSNNSETHRLIIEFLHANMKEALGIDFKISLLEWNSFLSVAGSHQFDMIRMSFTGGEDPLDLLENFTTGHKNNYGQYSNPEYDALIANARAEGSVEARNLHLVMAQALLCRDMPVIPVYVSSQVYLVRSDLRNRLNPSPDGWFSLEALAGASK